MTSNKRTIENNKTGSHSGSSRKKFPFVTSRQLLSTVPFKHQILSVVPNLFQMASQHFKETNTGYRSRKTDIRLWHPNLQSVSTLHIPTIKCPTEYGALKWIWPPFLPSVQMIFTSWLPSDYSWVLYGLIKVWNLLDFLCSCTYIGSDIGVQCILYLCHNVYSFKSGQIVESHPWDKYEVEHIPESWASPTLGWTMNSLLQDSDRCHLLQGIYPVPNIVLQSKTSFELSLWAP